MRHIFWRGVEAGVGAGLVVSGLLVGWVIWDQSHTKKTTVPQGISGASTGRLWGSKEAGQSANSDRPTAPRLGGTA